MYYSKNDAWDSGCNKSRRKNYNRQSNQVIHAKTQMYTKADSIIKTGFSRTMLLFSLLIALSLMLTGCRLPTSSTDIQEPDNKFEHDEKIETVADEISELQDDTSTEKSSEILVEVIDSDIQEIEISYADNNGFIPEKHVDEVIAEVLSYAESQMEIGNVTYYEEGLSSVYMELADDTGYMYIPKILGCSNGGSEIRIATFQPCYTEFLNRDGDTYINYVDAAAIKVEDFSYVYSFLSDNTDTDHDFNDSEVSLPVLKYFFTENSIVIWHGHGSYSATPGSALVTGIKLSYIKDSAFFLTNYLYDFLDKSLLFSNGDILVTKNFFDKYIDDDALTGSLIYLGACSGGADSGLSDVFIDKGAQTVFAYSGTIYTWYDLTMMRTIFNALTSNSEEPYTAGDALTFAKRMLSEHDYWVDKDGVEWTHNTEVLIFGDEEYTLSSMINLDGTAFDGYYVYKGNRDLYAFSIDFTQVDEVINGTIIDEFGEATFSGYIDGSYIVFTKTYNRIIGSEQPPRPEILYKGEITIGKLIEGEWTIIGEDTTGYFSIFLE